MRIRKAIVACAAAAGIAAGVFGSSPAAQAAPVDGVIEWGEFVVWQDINYWGPLYDAYGTIPTYHAGQRFVNSTVPLADHVSSVANYAGGTLDAYQAHYFGGPFITVLGYGQTFGSTSWTYSGLPYGFNDTLSSHKYR
jgi:hypothetical protein